MTQSTPRLVIRQIQKLAPRARYVVVFNQPLTQAQMDELIAVCKKSEIQILVLNDAKIVPLEQVAIVLPKLEESGINKMGLGRDGEGNPILPPGAGAP